MHATLENLLSHGPVVTDGAWGTQLQARGLPIGACPDAWNLSNPNAVEAVARAYVEAGSQIILTNTFGANRFILARQGLAGRVAEINAAGVEISRRAAGDRAKVFASMGPSGTMLMMGEVSEDDLRAGFTEQARAMAAAGAEAIVVETMTDPAEASLAVAAAKETGLPVVACMTFDSGAKLDRTMMGTTPEQARAIARGGADMVGSNCGQGVAGFVEICRRMHAASGRKVWAKANAGLPEMRDGKTHYAQTAEQFAEYVPQLIAAGAGFIGGCCGTLPESFPRDLREVANARALEKTSTTCPNRKRPHRPRVGGAMFGHYYNRYYNSPFCRVCRCRPALRAGRHGRPGETVREKADRSGQTSLHGGRPRGGVYSLRLKNLFTNPTSPVFPMIHVPPFKNLLSSGLLVLAPALPLPPPSQQPLPRRKRWPRPIAGLRPRSRPPPRRRGVNHA